MELTAWTISIFVIFISLNNVIWAQFTPTIQQSCYTNNSNPYVYFASKTAYEFVNGEDQKPVKVSGCEPIQFFLLTRHGTRYPDAEDIDQMKTELLKLRDSIWLNYQEKKTSLCIADITALKNWQLNLTTEDDNRLSPSGKEELKFIAKRYTARLPTLFASPSDDDRKFLFKHTSKLRALESAQAFASGLFNDQRIVPMYADDNLLMYYSNCSKLDLAVSDNAEVKTNINGFKQGTEIDKVLARVSRRLGFNYDLAYDLVDLAYEACRFDKAWNIEKISPWCAIFSDQDLKVLEYNEDLKYYYKHGYGTPALYQTGCPLVNDMFQHFKRGMERAHDAPIGIFYFTHSTLLQLVLTSLGIAKDNTPLKYDNYDQMADRKWQVSQIGPFAGNLGAVLLNCTSEYKVQFYLQEKEIPELCNFGLCRWKELEEMYGHMTDNQCTQKTVCDLNGGSILQFNVLVVLGLFIVNVIFN